jgi:hypothetical protein
VSFAYLPQWSKVFEGSMPEVSRDDAQALPERQKGRAGMKITINVDCTPAEAREMLGLPDLQPLQNAWLAEIEKRMMANLEQFSPEGLTRSWLSGAPAGADWIPNMFSALMPERKENERGDKTGGAAKT